MIEIEVLLMDLAHSKDLENHEFEPICLLFQPNSKIPYLGVNTIQKEKKKIHIAYNYEISKHCSLGDVKF